MGLPIIMIVVLLVRGATLPNAVDGIRLYAGVFNGDQLACGQIWQQALGVCPPILSHKTYFRMPR